MKFLPVLPLVAALAAPVLAQEARVALPLPPADLTKRPAPPEASPTAAVRNARPLTAGAPLPAAKPARRSGPGALPAFDRKQVFHTSEDDGTPWVRGETYKARFGSEGASYIPFLGSAAPRNFPLDLHLSSVALGGEPIGFDASVPAKCEGETMTYERGSLSERYSIGVDSIEQSFVFDTLPTGAQGELVLRIAATSELAGQRLDDRIEFGNELGSVRYGLATALDANGAHIAAETTLDGSEIVIRVPADFVAAAKLPLTIDPIISNFSIDTGTPNAFLPDCSYDLTNGCWLVVHEEVFSATDHDVVWRRIGALNGLSLGSGYVDSSLSAYWANPACANNNVMDRFFVVAEVGVPGSGPRKIYGRTVQGSNGALGTTLDIGAEDPFVDLVNPDVGGDPYGAPSYFCVVWEKEFSASDRDIYYRMVDPGNSLASSIQIVDISGGTYDTHPSISKSDEGGTWNVVWQRRSTSMPYRQDIRGARIGWAGNTVASSFAIDSSPTSTELPQASTSLNGSNRWAVVYQYDFGSDWDVDMILMDGTTVTDTVDVTGLEVLAGNLPTLLENQVHPDVDTDGWSFAVTYSESYQGSSYDYDVYVSTLAAVGNQLQLSEGHRQIAASTTPENNPSIASADGSGLAWRIELIVLDDATSLSTSGNIEGGLYDNALFTSFCHPTFDGVAACPCGNNPAGYGLGCNNSANTGGAQLVGGGTSSIGSDSMWLVSQFMPATALTVVNQGNGVLTNSVVFGQGVRCVGGTLKRLYIKTASGGGVSVPAPGDPAIHTRSAALGDSISAGTSRSYYAYYRDPVVLGGCSATSTFNTTQSVQAIWIP